MMRLDFLFFIGCLLFTNYCFSQNEESRYVNPDSIDGAIKATVYVDRKQVPQNRLVTYTVKVSWHGDLDRYEIEKLENPVLTNFEIVGNSSSNWVGELGGIKQAIISYEFILKPIDLGMGYIDGLFVEYRDRFQDTTSRLVTNRLEVKIIEPIREKNYQTWILGGSIFFFVLILFISGISIVKNKRAKETELKAKEMELVPIEDKFMNDLKQEVDLQNPNLVDSLSSISKLFRKYISERYQISALEITTQEICQELNEIAVSEKVIEQIEEILKSCDIAKFSGGQVERELLDRTYTLVEEILNKNKSDYIEYSNKNREVEL